MIPTVLVDIVLVANVERWISEGKINTSIFETLKAFDTVTLPDLIPIGQCLITRKYKVARCLKLAQVEIALYNIPLSAKARSVSGERPQRVSLATIPTVRKLATGS